MKDKIIMTQNTSTYYVWVGGSCDYGHKERVGTHDITTEAMAKTRTGFHQKLQ